jgi:hypothetical protein
MNLRIAAVCVASCFALATPAFATVPITATLVAPVARDSRPITGEAVWFCSASSCVTNQIEIFDLTVNTCKQLARRVGHIASFSAGARSLTADQLTQCNAVVH